VGIDEISAALGELRAEALHAKESRRVTHEKLDALVREVQELRAVVPRVVALEGAVPEIKRFVAWTERAKGAVFVLGVVWSGLTIVAAEGVRWILRKNGGF